MAQAAQYANPPAAAAPPPPAAPAGPVASTASIAVPPGAPVTAAPAPTPAPVMGNPITPGAPQPAAQAPNPFDQFDVPVQAKGAAAPANPFDQFDPTPAQRAPGYQAAKAAQTPSSAAGQTAASVGDQIVNGLTFNNADRVGGALSAASQYVHNLFTGTQGQPSPSQAYAATRDQIDQEDGEFQAAHPVASIAANLAGGLPIGAGAAKAVSMAPGLIAKGLAAEGAGIGLGAAYGAGANKANPGTGAITGAGEGAVLAPVMEAAGPVLGAAGNAVNNVFRPAALDATAQSRAAQYLGQQVANAPTPAATPQPPTLTRIVNAIQNAGKPPAVAPGVANGGLTVAETLGQQGTGMLAGMTRKPGVAGDLANNILGARRAGRTDRLVQGVLDATGVDPVAGRSSMENLVAQGRDSVNPAYTAIRADPSPVMTDGLQNLLDTDPHVASALNTVNANTRSPPAVPNASTWLRVRQQLADNVQRDPVTGKPMNVDFNDQVNNATSDLGTELKSAIPGFGDAQAAAALYKAPQASYTAARGMLFGATAKQTPADVQALWDAATTPAQQGAIQHAFAADILDKAVTKNTLTPASLTAPGVQQKLGIVFGQNAAAKINTLATGEQRMAQFENRVLPNVNSITAEASNYGDEGLKQAFLAGAQKAGGHILEGDPHRAGVAVVGNAAKYLLNVGKANSDTAFRNALAQQYLGDASSFMPNSLRSAPKTGTSIAPLISNAAVQGLAQTQGNN